MRWFVILAALALPLSGCTDYKLKQRAQADALAELKDPDTAKIQSVKVVEENGKRVVCLRVNAKNGYGAYGGYKWALWREGEEGRPPRVVWEGDAPVGLESDLMKMANIDIVSVRRQMLYRLCGQG